MASQLRDEVLTFFRQTPAGTFKASKIRNLAFPDKRQPTLTQLQENLDFMVSQGYLTEHEGEYRLHQNFARPHPWRR